MSAQSLTAICILSCSIRWEPTVWYFPNGIWESVWAHSLALSNIFEVVELSKQCSIIEIAVLDQWIGKSLKELDLRKHMGINIVGIKTGERKWS